MSMEGAVTEPPLDGQRDGETFVYPRDGVRLNKQHAAVWEVVRFGDWMTLAEVAERTGYPEASISARLRDFRKDKFGCLTVERRYIEDGLHQYRVLVPVREPEQLEMI